MTDKKSEKFSRFCTVCILVLTAFFAVCLLCASLVGTTVVSTGGGEGEIVTFVKDNFFVNLIITLALAAALCCLARFIDKIKLNTLLIVLTAWVLLFGGAFVCSAKLQPTQDPYIITFFARQAAHGDYSYYHEYFRFFPFQLGFALYEELFFRVFDWIAPNVPEGFSSLSLQLMNVFYVAAAYFALVKISGCVFKNSRVQKLAAFLLLLFVQPIFFTTFMYGNIPAFAFAVTSVWLFLLHRQSERTLYGIGSAAFLCIAVLLKLNSLLFVVALGIVWVICLLEKPRLKSALCLVLLVAGVLAVKPLPQRYYENKLGEELGSGIPQWGWMAMGFHEGQSASGWYDTEYTTTSFAQHDYDSKATGDFAKAAIVERLDEFKTAPKDAVEFFNRKFTSQWNDPSAQSLWVNQSHPSYSDYGKLHQFICEEHRDAVYSYMNIIQQLVLLCFTAGLLLLVRSGNITQALLPLVILGAMLYHLLFEAKAQYALCYYLLMMPTAAYALTYISNKRTKTDDKNAEK